MPALSPGCALVRGRHFAQRRPGNHGRHQEQPHVVHERRLPLERARCRPVEGAEVLEAYELSPIASAMQQRLKLAGALIVAGLAIELVSLFWSRPIAFLVFMFAGGLLLVLGVLIYLYSL